MKKRSRTRRRRRRPLWNTRRFQIFWWWGRRRVDELWTTTLICPQQSLYVMSRLLLLYRLRPSPGCSHMFLLLWRSRTRQPAAAASQTLTTQHVQRRVTQFMCENRLSLCYVVFKLLNKWSRVCVGQSACSEGFVASALCPGLHDVSTGESGVCPATGDTALPPPAWYSYKHINTHAHTERCRSTHVMICVCLSEGGARGRWKALKVDSRSGVEEMETLLRSVQDRVQQIHNRRHTLTQLVQQLHSKVHTNTQTTAEWLLGYYS